jgi:hypothetical protein
MLSKKPLKSRSMTESDFQQRCRHVTPRPTRIVLCSSHRSRRWSTRLPSGSARTIRSSAHRSPAHLIRLHLLPGFADQPLCCLQLCCLKFSFRHILSPGAWLFQGHILNAAARSDLGLACKAALRDQQPSSSAQHAFEASASPSSACRAITHYLCWPSGQGVTSNFRPSHPTQGRPLLHRSLHIH